jgi:predicted DNA-binding transcriptional regulator YafY
MDQFDLARAVDIDYTNHKGERRVRKIVPVGVMHFANNQWYPTDQWLFNAIDIEKNEMRSFSLNNIHGAGNQVSKDSESGSSGDSQSGGSADRKRADDAEAHAKLLQDQIDEVNLRTRTLQDENTALTDRLSSAETRNAASDQDDE